MANTCRRFFSRACSFAVYLDGSDAVTWERVTLIGMNFLNMLSLLLVSVIAGYPFVFEYHSGKTNISHTYPVPRQAQYFVKLFVIMLMVLALHIVFYIFITALGFIFAEDVFSAPYVIKTLKLTLLISATGYMLVPFTAILSIIFKNAGSFILAGVFYFILYMSFANTSYSKYVLPCAADNILKGYISTGELVSADATGTLVVSAVVFAVLVLAGAVCYSRIEI